MVLSGELIPVSARSALRRIKYFDAKNFSKFFKRT